MEWDNRVFSWNLVTRRFGREVYYVEVTDSTNRWMRGKLESIRLSGAVVVAGHQTMGRGRHDRKWYDSPGSSLLCSVFLRLADSAIRTGYLTLLPAIALARVLRKHDQLAEVSLKWPNDVLIGGRKVAGVLAEMVERDRQLAAIVGLGVNVQLVPRMSVEGSAAPTSIFDSTMWRPQRELLLASILSEWELLFDMLLGKEYELIQAAWGEFGPIQGTRMKRVESNSVIEGTFAGLGECGQLLLRDGDGILREIHSGDVSYA